MALYSSLSTLASFLANIDCLDLFRVLSLLILSIPLSKHIDGIKLLSLNTRKEGKQLFHTCYDNFGLHPDENEEFTKFSNGGVTVLL
jgi:hypothetical protein